MMIEKLITILRQSGADGWQIRDTHTEGWEFYFIRHSLDQNRCKEIRHINVTVYRKSEDGRWIGNASAEVYEGESDEAIRKLIDSLTERAALIRNRVYELNKPAAAEEMIQEDADPAKSAGAFIRLMQGMEESESEDINSYEIFTSRVVSRLITSEGIDITETYPSSMLEAVVNARHDSHEIELYRMYRSSVCDEEAIRKDLAKTMKTGHDRLKAVPTPNLNRAAVLFTGMDAVTLYRYFLERCDAALVCRHMSPYQINEEIAPDIQGDRITLKTVRFLENSPANRAYDREGAPIRDLTLIENGIVRAYTGNRMFASYIGLEDNFIAGNFSVSGGSCTEEQLRQGTWLEAAEFSDFQTDSVTGDFFGEIRLAYYHDGDQTIPVSGGSISGNLNELLKNMRMSAEQSQYGEARIPSLTRIENAVITGCEGGQ